MPLSWILRDALAQLEELAGRNYGTLEIEQGQTLDSNDVKFAMKSVQGFLIQKFATPEALPLLCERLLAIEAELQPAPEAESVLPPKHGKRNSLKFPAMSAMKKPQKPDNLPRKEDKQANIDQQSDESLTFFVLDTLHKVFSSIMKTDGIFKKQTEFEVDISVDSPANPSLLRTVPTNVIDFCFKHLNHNQSVAVRLASGKCLGVLSHCFLEYTVNLFLKMHENLKKDEDEREYTTYQQAVKYLQFGIATEEQYDHTLGYLQSLIKLMKKIDRGVLRGAICETLTIMFSGIMSSSDASRQSAWKEFSVDSTRNTSFYDCYNKIYVLVYKWSKKAKHSIFCYELMYRMVTMCSNYAFYANKDRADAIGLILKGLSKGENRMKHLQYVHNYVRDIPEEFVTRDMQFFTEQCKDIVKEIMKIRHPEQEEHATMTDILIKTGRKHFHFVVHQVVGDALQIDKGEHSTKQKTIWLNALAKLASENTIAILDHNYHLGPIVFQYLVSEAEYLKTHSKKHVITNREDTLSIIRAALACFPNIRPNLPEQLEAATAAIGSSLTLHPDRGISTSAALCMQEFFLLDPKKHLIPTMFCFVDILGNMGLSRSQELLKTVNTVTFLLNTTIEYLQKDASQTNHLVSASDWMSLRQHMEAACLMWLCHPEPWVRSTVARVLELFCCESLREIEKKKANRPPFLVDALFPQGNVSEVAADASFEKNLRQVTERCYPQFEGVFSWAWSKMNAHLDDLGEILEGNEADLAPDSIGVQVYLKKLHFLCMLLRQPNCVDNSQRQSFDESNGGPKSRPHIFSPPMRLDKFTGSKLDFSYFFEDVLTILHLENPQPVMKTIKEKLCELLSEVDPSCFTELTMYLRLPTAQKDIREGIVNPTPLKKKPNNLKEQLPSVVVFHQHEYTLDIVSRLMGRVRASKYEVQNEILFATLDQLIDNWIKDHENNNGVTFSRHTCQGKRHVVNLITHYIELKRRKAKFSPQDEVAERNHTLFLLITSRLMPDNGDAHSGGSYDSTPITRNRAKSRLTPATMRTISRIRGMRGTVASVDLGNQFGKSDSNVNLSQFMDEEEEEQEMESEDGSVEVADLVKDDPYDNIHGLEQALLQALCSLIQSMGSIADPDFLKMILCFVHRVTFRGPHLSDGISRVLEVVLAHHSSMMQEFIEKSFPSTHLTEVNNTLISMNVATGHVNAHIDRLLNQALMPLAPPMQEPHTCELLSYTSSVSLLYAKAVINNFISRLDFWVEQGISLATILLVSLMHQISPDMETRTLSLSLARVLAERNHDPLDPGCKIRLFSHKAQLMYTQATIQYSQALAGRAKNHGSVIQPLFCEAARFNKILGFERSETLLRILSPWVGQIGTVLIQKRLKDKRKFLKNYLKQDTGDTDVDHEVEQAAQEIMRPLFALTSECHKADKASVITPTLVQLWMELLSREHAVLVVPQVIKFLVIQYTEAEEHCRGEEGVALTEQMDRTLLLPKMLLLHLSRSKDEEMSKLIVDQLAKLVRHYPAECPENPQTFLEWQKPKQSDKEPINPTERNAFELILNLVFENGTLFEEYFPALLQNACVLFYGTSHAEAMISYILLHLSIQDNGQTMPIPKLVVALSEAHPTVAQKWADTALQWAVNTQDEQVAIQSLKLFKQLQGGSFDFGDGQTSLLKIITNLYLAIRLKQVSRVTEILGILLMEKTVVPYDTEGWIALTSVGWSLLCFSDVHYFKLGLSLLTHMFTYNAVSREEQCKWLLSLGEHLSFFRRDENQPFDEAIAEIALKGFTSGQTSQACVRVVQSLAPFYTKHLPSSNKLMALLMLGSFLLRRIDIQEFSKDKRSTQDVTRAEVEARHLEFIQRSRDCLHLCDLLSTYQGYEKDKANQTNLAGMASVMKTIAVDLADQVPGFPLKALLAKNDKLEVTALIDAELARRQRGEKSPHGNFNPVETDTSASNELETQVSAKFFEHFASIFSSRDSFDFIITCFKVLLNHGSTNWKTELLGMLGYFLKFTSHKCNSEQFLELSELMVVNYYAPSATILRLAENISYILVHKSEYNGQQLNAFNFIRPRVRVQKKVVNQDILVCGFQAKKKTSEGEDCLQRLASQAFPILQHMYANPRAVRRQDDDPTRGKVLPSRPKSEVGENNLELPAHLADRQRPRVSSGSSQKPPTPKRKAPGVPTRTNSNNSRTCRTSKSSKREAPGDAIGELKVRDHRSLSSKRRDDGSDGAGSDSDSSESHIPGVNIHSSDDKHFQQFQTLSPGKMQFFESVKYNEDEDFDAAEVDGLLLVENSPTFLKGDMTLSKNGDTLRSVSGVINILPPPTAAEMEDIRKIAASREIATREQARSISSSDSGSGKSTFSRRYSMNKGQEASTDKENQLPRRGFIQPQMS